MKFFCEYCGNRIDADIDNKCPNCGASYKKNKTYIRLEEEKKQEELNNKELRENVKKTAVTGLKIFGIVQIVPIVIVLTIIIVGGILIFTGIKKTYQDDFDFGSEGKVETTAEAKFNEYAKIKDYKFKVTKYETIYLPFEKPEEGYKYVKFYFQLENTSGKQINRDDVNCIVDGIAQKNEFTSGYSDLPFFIGKDLTVTGTSTFIVPTDATSYDIKYGDNIIIHIEK